MKKILTYKGAAMSWECDSNDHLNVMYYVNKFEQGGRNFILEMGLKEVFGNNDVGVVVLEQKINYFKEVTEDDLLFIESSLLDVKNKAFTILHEMYCSNSNELVCTMKIVKVLFDKINRSALPFPADLRAELLKKI